MSYCALVKITITAMSLPWGGLNDIGPSPNCITGCNILWHTPHTSHNNGKEVDLSVRELPTFYYKLLLRQVILDNSVDPIPKFAQCEGGTGKFGNLITNLDGPQSPVFIQADCRSITGPSSPNGLATHIHVIFAK